MGAAAPGRRERGLPHPARDGAPARDARGGVRHDCSDYGGLFDGAACGDAGAFGDVVEAGGEDVVVGAWTGEVGVGELDFGSECWEACGEVWVLV